MMFNNTAFCMVILSMISMISSNLQQQPNHRQQEGLEQQKRREYSIRLVSDSTKRSGIVEQYEGKLWKPVCGDNCWTNKTANVACKELQFIGGIKRSEDTTKVTGNHGNDTSGGYNCTYLHNCSKINRTCDLNGCSSVAQVTCIGAVQLVGSKIKRAAVEVFRKNRGGVLKWGGLCSGCWSPNNTNVVCKQFGLRSGELQAGTIENASKTVWKHVNYSCSGNETDISDCPTTEEECKNCGNGKVIVKCHPDLGYNQTCTNDESCIRGLVCKQTDNNVCRCENETSSFWNADKKACEERSNLEQNCTFNMYNSCKDTLVCTGDATSAVCKSKNDGVGTGEEADGRKNLGYNQTCTNDESCISGLVCKQTDNNVCRCENEASSFWNADKKACEERSGLGQKCTFNSCIDTLVCTEDATGAVCKIKKDDVGTGEEEDDQANLPIYVGVPIGCLVAISVIVITVWYCKRKKRKNSIYGRTVSYSNGQSSNLNIDVGYSEVVLEGNVNGDQAYDLVQPMNLGNDGNYSIAMSDVKGPRSESPTQTTATNNYGYGVLGGKRAENDDNDMYSHARRMNDTGEYDAFDKRDRDTDVNDLYDHTRGITMENQYDEFQKRK